VAGSVPRGYVLAPCRRRSGLLRASGAASVHLGYDPHVVAIPGGVVDPGERPGPGRADRTPAAGCARRPRLRRGPAWASWPSRAVWSIMVNARARSSRPNASRRMRSGATASARSSLGQVARDADPGVPVPQRRHDLAGHILGSTVAIPCPSRPPEDSWVRIRARQHPTHADAGPGHLGAQSCREPHRDGAACAVDRPAGYRNLAGHRGDVDDVAALTRDDRRHDRGDGPSSDSPFRCRPKTQTPIY
jgi:hypothetical protein